MFGLGYRERSSLAARCLSICHQIVCLCFMSLAVLWPVFTLPIGHAGESVLCACTPPLLSLRPPLSPVFCLYPQISVCLPVHVRNGVCPRVSLSIYLVTICPVVRFSAPPIGHAERAVVGGLRPGCPDGHRWDGLDRAGGSMLAGRTVATAAAAAAV